MLPRQLRQAPGRQGRTVGKGLVEVPDQPRQDLHYLRLDAKLLVDRLKPLGRQPGVAGLVIFRHGEADGERPQGAAGKLPHEAHDDRRIDAAGEERPQRHVALQAGLDRRGKPAAEQPGVLAPRQRLFDAEVGLPVGPDLQPVVAVNCQVARRQFADALPDCPRVGHVLVGQVFIKGLRVDVPRHAGDLQDALQLAGEEQPAGLVAIDQRLLAQPIAGQEEKAALGVPEGEGEHAVQQADHFRAFILVEMDEGFRIAERLEDGGRGLPGGGGGRGSCRSRR